jgi:polyisoprenoid-binding protein YceI
MRHAPIFTANFTPIFAASLLAGVLVAGAVQAASWTVDHARSRLGFRGAMEGAAFDGTFRSWDAQISFDPKALSTSHVSVSVDLASAVTGDQDRDQNLPTDDWFAIKRFPKAVFTANRFVDRGGGRYEAQGELELKGVRRPVVLPFTLAVSGGVARMQGSTTLDRTAFNVGSGRWSTPDEVAKAVTVVVDITARQSR